MALSISILVYTFLHFPIGAIVLLIQVCSSKGARTVSGHSTSTSTKLKLLFSRIIRFIE